MNSTAVDYFHFRHYSKAQLCVMEKPTESRTSAFRLKNLHIYLSWWNWTCFCGCLPQKGIRQPSTANYFVGWNARAPRRWQSITKTHAEDEANKGKSSMLKTFLPSEGKTHDVSSSLGFAYQFQAPARRDSVCCPLWDVVLLRELQVSTVEGHLQISPPYLTSVFSSLVPRPLFKPTFLAVQSHDSIINAPVPMAQRVYPSLWFTRPSGLLPSWLSCGDSFLSTPFFCPKAKHNRSLSLLETLVLFA